jgi:hypothetical protein
MKNLKSLNNPVPGTFRSLLYIALSITMTMVVIVLAVFFCKINIHLGILNMHVVDVVLYCALFLSMLYGVQCVVNNELKNIWRLFVIVPIILSVYVILITIKPAGLDYFQLYLSLRQILVAILILVLPLAIIIHKKINFVLFLLVFIGSILIVVMLPGLGKNLEVYNRCSVEAVAKRIKNSQEFNFSTY